MVVEVVVEATAMLITVHVRSLFNPDINRCVLSYYYPQLQVENLRLRKVKSVHMSLTLLVTASELEILSPSRAPGNMAENNVELGEGFGYFSYRVVLSPGLDSTVEGMML